MNLLHGVLALLILSQGCLPINPAQNSSTQTAKKSMILSDENYTDRVGNVRISTPSAIADYQQIIKPLNSAPFLLSFDLLDEEYKYIHLKLIHCNADWSRSQLSDLEYLSEYNETPINRYEFSQSANSVYVSYGVTIPQVKLSGNYVIMVYENNDESQLLFTRKILVYDNDVAIDAQMRQSNGASYQQTHHQLDMSVRYGGLSVSNPSLDFKTILLQNQNWDTAIKNLLPTSTLVDQNLLKYDYFHQENNFPALNCFRFFDIRAATYRGQNVASIRQTARGVEAYLEEEKSRKGLAYGSPLNKDLDGRYFTRNTDLYASEINSEYVWVNFTLLSEQLIGNVYVYGRYNNWNLDEKNLMSYDSSKQAYTCDLLLKQGYYSYLFIIESPEMAYYYLEGSHVQNRNEYEILVYYRAPGTIYDKLVGYRKLE